MVEFKTYYSVSIEDHVVNKSETPTTDNSLQKIIDKYGLFVLMLTSNGEIKDVIDSDVKDKIIFLARKLESLSSKERETMNAMAEEIALLTASLVKTFGKEGKTFQKYFRQFAMIDLLEEHLTGKVSFIRKEGKMLDYKVNRVAKYLNIDIDRENIRDFEVMYSGDVIKLNGQEYYKREESEKSDLPKINRIVRK